MGCSARTSLLLGCLGSFSGFLLPSDLFEIGELSLMGRESFLQLSRSLQELAGCTVDLSLHVKFVALDLQDRWLRVAILGTLCQDETLLGHVLLNLLDGLVGE